jgi:hypothetical protein
MQVLKDIINTIKESSNGLLTEESLNAIHSKFEEVVNEKVSLSVEAALVKQDGEYTEKLSSLVDAIDKNNTRKLHKLVEAIDKNHSAKLNKIVTKYKHALVSEAKTFKKSVVGSLSRYLEVYLEQAVPQEFINEAVKERKAQTVLNNLRKSLAIDSTLMKESIRGAVSDGRDQLIEANNKLATAEAEIAKLKRKVDRVEGEMVFEQKTSTLPTRKKEYVKRVLEGKSAAFIAENIEYTLNLFDKAAQDKTDLIREQAMNDVTAIDDAPVASKKPAIIAEKVEEVQNTSVYMSELSKY